MKEAYFFFLSRRVLTFVYSGTKSPVGVSGSACLLHGFHVSIFMCVWMNEASRLEQILSDLSRFSCYKAAALEGPSFYL